MLEWAGGEEWRGGHASWTVETFADQFKKLKTKSKMKPALFTETFLSEKIPTWADWFSDKFKAWRR